MYYCFDGYNTANGFRGRTILFNRTTLSLLRRKNGQILTKNANPPRTKKFRGIHEFAQRICASAYRPVSQFRIASSTNQFFDLTAARIPTIIMRTSLLWRADKPGVLGNPGRGLHGWRQNIFLLPAVLFPHLERELQLPLSVVSSKVAVSKSPFRNVIRT